MKHSDADNSKVWMSVRTFYCCVWTPWKATAAEQSMRAKGGKMRTRVAAGWIMWMSWLGKKKTQDDGLNNLFFNLSIIWNQEGLQSGGQEESLFCLGWCLPAYITLFLSAGDLMSPYRVTSWCGGSCGPKPAATAACVPTVGGSVCVLRRGRHSYGSSGFYHCHDALTAVT